MKKLLLTAAAVIISAFSLSAQESFDDEAILGQLQLLFDEINQAANNKDYKAAETLSQKAIEFFDKQPDQFRYDYEIFQGYFYYNLACYKSLLKNKKEALDALEMAYSHGFNDYETMVGDSDLKNIRKDKRYKKLMARLREETDYPHILKGSGPYEPGSASDMPAFTYMEMDNPDLIRVREYFNLDSIAGPGDEISRIKNLLYWAHDIVRHDGGSSNPDSKNAIDIVNICRERGRGVNCRMMAQLLNECYLAAGFKSRFVTCMPKVMVNDCHVINVVWSETLGRWLWMDPTFAAYVADENGELLGIEEVRERLIDGRPLVLNEDANWNHEHPQTKEYYLETYMTKNLYYVTCRLDSEYNSETSFEGKKWSRVVALVPTGYEPDHDSSHMTTTDNRYFWSSPYSE